MAQEVNSAGLTVQLEPTIHGASSELERLFTLAPGLLCIATSEGRFVKLNAEWQRVLGWSLEQLEGVSVSDFMHPDDAEVANPTGHDLPARMLINGSVHRFRCADGSYRWLEWCCSSGDNGHVYISAHDVTKHIESEHRLGESVRQSQRLASVARLASGAAHDFNNMLTVVLGSASSLLDRRELGATERADLENITEAAQRSASLTRQLLALSRQQVLQPRLIDAKEVVTQATRMLRRVLGEDIDLTLQTTDETVLVFADPDQIQQVLVNLALNARDAMPTGGALTVEVSRTVLDAGFVAAHPDGVPGTYVHVVVTDTGQGMDEATRSRIFEPCSAKADLGIGLSLATAYGIIRQSDGYIWVRSEPGAGSSFDVYLPLLASFPAETAQGNAREGRKPTETILLVEDEDAVRNVIRKVLDKAGYNVLLAANGELALTCASEHPHPIHLLLTDVVMPKMTGCELAQRIVRARPDTRVLYMSGYTPDAIVNQGVIDEGVQFIQKPLRPAQLLAKIRSILDKA